MNDLKVKLEIVNDISKKTNKPYKALKIVITDKISKLVFLTPAEWELLEINQRLSK